MTLKLPPKTPKKPSAPHKIEPADVFRHLDEQLGPPERIEDLSNIDYDCGVFVNRWCSLFGHRAKALKELRELIERVRRE